MPDTEQPSNDELAARHREAQTAAFEWAQRAETEYSAADQHADYAREKAGNDYLRQPVARAREEAQRYSARFANASRLAEVWAHVALALTPLPAPSNGQPATYDIQIIDSSEAAELKGQLRWLQDRQLRQSSAGEPGP